MNVLGTFFSNYQSNSNESSHYQSNPCPHITIMNHDEDKFFYGFIPVWAIIVFAIAILFAGVFIAGIICYLSGCRRPITDDTNNENLVPIVEQPLIEKTADKSKQMFNDDQF